MYKIKEEEIKKYKKWGTVRKLSKETGLSENYISQVLNDRKYIAKKSAYAITKAIDEFFKIEDLFEIM